jgi:hypothetical protein
MAAFSCAAGANSGAACRFPKDTTLKFELLPGLRESNL